MADAELSLVTMEYLVVTHQETCTLMIFVIMLAIFAILLGDVSDLPSVLLKEDMKSS